MLIRIVYILSLLAIFFEGFCQTTDYNYVNQYQPLLPVTDTVQLNQLDNKNKLKSIDFLDGEGRIIQKVNVGVTPENNDLIQTYVYDIAGRQTIHYLPFPRETLKSSFVTNPIDKLIQFYDQPSQQIVSSSYPFIEREFDDSPVNQVIKQGSPGEAWNIKGDHVATSTSYGNKEPIPRWKVNQDGQCSLNGSYLAGSLYVKEISDENKNISLEYVDKTGKIILKESLMKDIRVQTYYVYDRKGLLRYVFPPLASAKQIPDQKLIYEYNYDDRNRLIRKKLPGAEEVLMVYDKLDRLVLTQDGNLRKDSLWNYFKYDILGRQVESGMYKNLASREILQSTLNNKSTNFEERNGADYTNNAFPGLNCTPYIITYYDDYSFITNEQYNYSDVDFSLKTAEYPDIVEPVPASSTKGFQTGSKVYIPTENKWLLSVNYYDKYGKVLQSVSENYLGGYDRFSQIFDFRGKVINSELEHSPDGNNFTRIENRFEYDHAERLKKVYQKINNQPVIIVSENNYNQLGQLVEKKLHSSEVGDNYLETLNYTYNIRGWFTGINDVEDPGSHLFALKLDYDQPENGLDATPQYNGNISSMIWSSGGLNEERGYGFQYDNLNRLNRAKYGKKAGEWSNIDENYSVPAIGYDLNGNIDTLVRAGQIAPGYYGLIDNLSYSYEGNQLIAVDDDGETTDDEYDFRDRGSKFDEENSLPEYQYDANGNMISDANKGILHIQYNYLNLPEEIWFENNRLIRYIYSAGGVKLRKEVFDENGTLIDQWDYNGNFVYQNEELEFILTDEGRMIADSAGFTYEYFLKDHLGNTRLSFRVEENLAVVTQENHYYPFGMQLYGLNAEEMERPDEKANKFLYNGKELQDDFGLGWYDYGARMYDPELGRWHVMDPHAESYLNWTSYNYVANNPLIFTDPTGMDWYTSNDGSATMWKGGNNNIDGYKNIGANYTQNIGNGVSIGYTQNEATSMTFMNLKTSEWESQMNSDGTTGNCYDSCTDIMDNANSETGGKSSETLIANHGANGVVTTANGNANSGQSIIDNTIENGEPIMIGVDYKTKQTHNLQSNGGDGMTDHFVVIVGKTETLNHGNITSVNYRFFDPRTSHQSKGTHSSNTLQWGTNNLLEGVYYNNGGATSKSYTITTIRPNN